MVLDLGGCCVDLEEKRNGLTPLLYASMGFGARQKLDHIRLLLDRGANVHARDKKGRTCLHLAIMNAVGFVSTDKEVVLLLIRAGAEISATSFRGTTTSQMAYRKGTAWKAEMRGSYGGDLWDAVLSERGYDVLEFRKGFPRKPIYTDDYTRRGFEDLWRGREHCCPYYDDPAVWYSEGNHETGIDYQKEMDEIGEETEDSDSDSEYSIEERTEETENCEDENEGGKGWMEGCVYDMNQLHKSMEVYEDGRHAREGDIEESRGEKGDNGIVERTSLEHGMTSLEIATRNEEAGRSSAATFDLHLDDSALTLEDWATSQTPSRYFQMLAIDPSFESNPWQ